MNPRTSEALIQEVGQRSLLPVYEESQVWTRCLYPDPSEPCDKPLTRWPDASWRCALGHYNSGSTVRREALGRLVREVWVVWARDQDNPKPHHLLSWEDLDEGGREVDRRIGETLMGIRDWRVGQVPGNRSGSAERPNEAPLACDRCAYSTDRLGQCLLKLSHIGPHDYEFSDVYVRSRTNDAPLECAPWITVINREQKVEALPWADEASARTYFDLAQTQWSESWLCRAVIGPRDMKGMTHPAPRTDKARDDSYEKLLANRNRYARCAERIWALFPKDPLGDDPAHFYLERLEALLDRGLLAPSRTETPIIERECDRCDGLGRVKHETWEGCERCFGTGKLWASGSEIGGNR